MLDFSRPLAVISDVHGNREALVAVLGDIGLIGIENIVNLGDCVGYGPEPEACIDLLQQNCTVNLLGNHDYAVLNSVDNFNQIAKEAIHYTREKLSQQFSDDQESVRRCHFLRQLLPIYEKNNYEFMHGSPRRPITEYILPSDPICEPFKIDDIFNAMAHRYCFVGHTHFPGVIEEYNDNFIHPNEMDALTYPLSGRRIIANVGSVGQPRDGDNRACYAILHGEKITWRRVAYPVIITAQKIAAQPQLNDYLGKRLFAGQ